VHVAEGFLGPPLPEILPSLARSGAPLPHAQHICEFDIFCEISAQQKYHPPQLIRKRREIHIPWPASAPISPGLKPEFLFSETDG
jgi:hypothetical protein